jgi:hypothetical protein
VALEQEWEDLYDNSPLATPFQSWAWLYSWWESFGKDYELRLITVRDGDLLVGLIPLMLEYRWSFHKLLFIGEGHQLDLLARKGWEDKVSEAGIRTVRQRDSWRLIDLEFVSPTAAAWYIFRQWNSRQTCILTDSNIFIEVKTWDELLTFLGRKHRATVRRTLRRTEEDGVRSLLARPEEAEQAARRLVALHQELRQGRLISWWHLTPEFESFIVAAARRMTERGLGRILEFWRDGEVIMSSFAVFGNKITHAFLIGVSQQAMQRYQWSSVAIYEVLNMARSRNSAYLCLAQRGDPYKQRWPHEDVPYYRIVLGRNPVSWSSYSVYLSLRARAARYMKTNNTPRLIKKAAEELKRRGF